MFLVTNRIVYPDKTGFNVLGDQPNPQGSQELLAVEVIRTANKTELVPVPDKIKRADWTKYGLTVAAVKDLGFDDTVSDVPGSAYVANELLKKLNKLPKSKRCVLLYVHGYNTKVESVINTTLELEKTYGVVCLPFTWPSNGGGRPIWKKAHGLASYLSDKQDARSSVNALDRLILRIGNYTENLFGRRRVNVLEEAAKKFPNDLEARLRFQSKALDSLCPVKVSLLLHSMGNYLFQYVMASESNQSSRALLFENIILASADVNNSDHAEWVNRIPFRRNIYVTINEDDFALDAARKKFGDEQKARLGHYRHSLNAASAKYIDFTNVSAVGNAHTYFLDSPINNKSIREFFQAAFTGLRAEEKVGMRYDPAENIYQLRSVAITQ